MPLYFAYGSNMSPRQMRARCPGARPAGRAILHGWRFIISTRGGANIVPARGHSVQGALWYVRREHVVALNGWEGVDLGVYRRRFVVVATEAGRRTAMTYVSRFTWPGHSSVTYMKTAILPGAEAFQLTSDYCAELGSWLRRRPIGPVTIRYRGRRSPKLRMAKKR